MTFNVYRQFDRIPPVARGIALGIFDGVHLGHRHLILTMIRRSEELDLLPAVFTFSYEAGMDFNERKVNHDFLMTDDEKIEALHALGVKDVFLIPLTSEFCHLSAESFLRSVLEEKLHAHLLAIGEDGRFGWMGRGDVAFLKEYAEHHALEPLIVPDFTWKGVKVTSTRIREALSLGQVEGATEMMGRAFRLQGTVMNDSNLESRIGFSTANFPYPPTAALLRRGVYATYARLDGERLPSISYIGCAPSVRKAGNEMLVETHIFDYSDCLYGQVIDVEFGTFVRDECIFSSIQNFVPRVRDDFERVRAWHYEGGNALLSGR